MIKIFDVSLHCAVSADLAAIDSLSKAPVSGYAAIVGRHARALGREGTGHLWVSDAAWHRDPTRVAALSRLARAAGLRLSASTDPRRKDAAAAASSALLDGLVLSPLHGGFGADEIRGLASWRALCAATVKARKPVFVTTAYGTPDLYRYDSLEFLTLALRELKGAVPVVALHGGGHRFKDLVLLADAHPELTIDLSFSILYYAGSSLAADWAWAMRRLGPGRFVFGSDEPFASRKDTLASFSSLMKSAGWDASSRAKALCGNANILFAPRESRHGRS